MCSLVGYKGSKLRSSIQHWGGSTFCISLSLGVSGARVKISAHKAQCLTGSRCNSIDVVVPFQVMLSGGGGGGGALNFFLGRGVRPGFPKRGACKLTFASEKGGL